MESIKIDLINELTSNFNKHQYPTSDNQIRDAMSLLINSAVTANGNLLTFIRSLFFASQTMAQSNTAIIPYSPYSLTHNTDWEMSSQSQPRFESSLESLLSPEEEYPLDPLVNQAMSDNSIATSLNIPNDTPCSTSTQTLPTEKSDQEPKRADMTETNAALPGATTVAVAAAGVTSVAESVETENGSDEPENENKATNFWGKINIPDLWEEPDEDFLERMNEDNDFEVELIKKKQKGDKKKFSHPMEIKFKLSSIPEKIKCLNSIYKVFLLDEVYVPGQDEHNHFLENFNEPPKPKKNNSITTKIGQITPENLLIYITHTSSSIPFLSPIPLNPNPTYIKY